jgi:chloramphenicol 3-O phosphotransferase
MLKNADFGKIILLNGASSAGKSTICNALQKELDEPFLQFSMDLLLFNTNVLPKRPNEGGLFSWPVMRPKLFQGYYNCLSGLAMAGNNLLVDYIIESKEQLDNLIDCLGYLDVFLVGVHCPLPELERREKQRGDRGIGDAKRDFETVHTFTTYDFEVDSDRSVDLIAGEIATAWKQRGYPVRFHLLNAERDQ